MKRTIYLVVLCAVLTLTGCTKGDDTTNSLKERTAWNRLDASMKAKDLELSLAIVDSMVQADIVSEVKADNLRARAYDHNWQMRIAEHYYRKSYEALRDNPEQDWDTFTDSGYRWAALRFARGDIDGSLGVTSAMLAMAEERADFPKSAKINLLMLMAEAQFHLMQYDESLQNRQKAYEAQQLECKEHQRAELPWISMSISSQLFYVGDTDGAQAWLERGEQEFARFEQQSNDTMMIEEWKGHFALKRAMIQQEKGQTAEAAATFAAIPHGRIAEPRAYMEAADYLMAAGRYDEAAYWYEQLDNTYAAANGAQMTFDNIIDLLTPRYSAYRMAGRDADALVFADSIIAAIDDALVWQKKSDAAELAVIYQTNEKELQLSAFHYKLRTNRLVVITLVVILLLVGYFLFRSYKYNKVLAAKNRSLYEQMQQREQAEARQREQMQTQPTESLSQNAQLYRRLCELMKNPDVYTDADTNHETLARLLGTNRTYINDALHECTDMTPADFINQYRIRHAARLLASTQEPIGIIIEQSGITNRATFSRLFREHYAMTPSEYRLAAREETNLA